MGRILTKDQAVAFTGLDEKTFDNYFKKAEEFKCLPRTGKQWFKFDQDELQNWLDGRKWRTVELTAKDYALCLDFALAVHFRGYVTADWGGARQREFGQKLTNWVKGQLAEIAVQKFFKQEFGIAVELDFALHPNIVPQDIIRIMDGGQPREPKIGVGIKSSKPKSTRLILSLNEVNLPDRSSDVYILGRPDIPDDHLIRVARADIIQAVKDQPHFASYKDQIPNFESIPCEIAGWCNKEELELVDSVPEAEITDSRYVKKTGLLHRSKEKWIELLNRL